MVLELGCSDSGYGFRGVGVWLQAFSQTRRQTLPYPQPRITSLYIIQTPPPKLHKRQVPRAKYESATIELRGSEAKIRDLDEQLALLRPSPKITLTRTSIYDTDSGSMKITTHLDHASLCEIASGTNWSNRWTCRLFIMNTHRG